MPSALKGLNMRIFLKLLVLVILISCNPQSNKQESAPVDSSNVTSTTNQEIDSEFYVEIEDAYLGLYLPMEYCNYLKLTRNHSLSMHSENASYHSFLNVKKNIIYSDLQWHDGYAIKRSEVDNFRFEIIDGNSTIVDSSGNKYNRIAIHSESIYQTLNSYIANIVFEPLIINSSISLQDGKVEIDGMQFSISLDDMFFPKNCNLILYNKDAEIIIGLIISDNNYNFYRIIPGDEEIGYKLTNEIIFQLTGV